MHRIESTYFDSMTENPVLMALGAGMLSWLSIAFGALFIYLKRDFSRKMMDILFGAAGGMMLCAAFLGLLQPAYEMSSSLGKFAFVPIIAGLVIGVVFLLALDELLPHIHAFQGKTEGIPASWRRSVMLVSAMALHHIPEGLSIGVSYGAAQAVSAIPDLAAGGLGAAFMLTVSIMLQNVPEGLIVSTTLRAEGVSVGKSAFFGVMSGATAPLGAFLGAVGAGIAQSILPVCLAFAAGAMIYVVIEEVVPEANADGNGNLASVSSVVGIALVIAISSLIGD